MSGGSLRRTLVSVVVLMGVLAGCGGDEPAAYCTQVADYLDFEADFSSATTDPGALEDYMEAWSARLEDLSEVAPSDVTADLGELSDGVEVIDDRLAAKDYDILLLELGELDVEGMDAAYAGFQESMGETCGLGPNAPDPEAPQPLSADELNDLEDFGAGSDEFVAVVTEGLLLTYDLTETEARCLAEAMDDTDFGRLLDGRPLADGGSEDFVAAIDDCGVDPDALTPTE